MITQLFEGENRFDVVVRWLAPYRHTVDAIRRITAATPDGTQIPLGQIAKI
jgi:Cu/Ag efflux pump CusA